MGLASILSGGLAATIIEAKDKVLIAEHGCKDVGNTCQRAKIDFLCFICSSVIAAMIDTRGFVCLLSLLDLICFNDLFYLYVLDWSRTFYHVLIDVIMT